MSTASLPSYHFAPRDTEHLLASRPRVRGPQGNFVKNSRSGGVVLRLNNQQNNATLPEYGRGGILEGTVELKNPESIQSVEVKIEGSLRLKEIAEGGTNNSSLCLDVQSLWSRDNSDGRCSESLPFILTLPMTYSDGKATYPLPPTYEAHLSGVPGFTANIDYEVSATVTRRKVSLFGVANTRTISTPIIVQSRSRPGLPLPTPLTNNFTHPSAIHDEDWALHRGTIKAKAPRGNDIDVRLYLPSLHVFSTTDPIPFHLFLLSSAFSLASYLPYAPAVARASGSPSGQGSNSDVLRPGVTRIQLLRQTSVDVRSITKRTMPVRGNNTDIWKTVQIGEGVFRRHGTDAKRASLGGGQDWTAWSGEIIVDRNVKIGGFRASGLNVKDFIVLSMHPPDPAKSPFTDVRLVVPIKLATDPWSADEYGPDVGIAGYSDSDPALDDHEPPELSYE